tara:strand:+ start:76 stop:636 length:561 start_codon:yes stop_codon:yes gene_type:complete
MAVPSSGTLSMVKIARERKYNDYNGSQTMGTISMRDLMEGGNSGGSTISYPAINNQACNNNTLPFGGQSLSSMTETDTYTGCGTGCTIRPYMYNSSGTDISSSVYVASTVTIANIYPGSSLPYQNVVYYSNPNTGALLANGQYSVDVVRTNNGQSGCNSCSGNGSCASQLIQITNGIPQARPVGTC